MFQCLVRHSVHGKDGAIALEVLRRLCEQSLLCIDRCYISSFLSEELRDITHCLSEIRFRLCQGNLGIARVELYQHLPTPHELGLVGVYAYYGATDLRGQSHEIAVDVGV